MRQPTRREILVTLGTALLLAVLQIGVTFNPENVTNWQVWLVATGGSVARSVSQRMLERLFGIG